jgi:hypothetical protein
MLQRQLPPHEPQPLPLQWKLLPKKRNSRGGNVTSPVGT